MVGGELLAYANFLLLLLLLLFLVVLITCCSGVRYWKMRVLVGVKRAVDYAVKIRVSPDKSGRV